MAQVASRIPMGAALRQLLVELKPQGAISDVTALWEGPLDAPRRYQVKGQLNGLSLAARPASDAHRIGRPGLRNASLQLNATETGGTAKLAVLAGMIEVPGVFADPRVPLDRLAAELQWSIGAGKVTVRVKNASFSNPDMQGDFDATWNTGPGGSFARGGRLPGQIEVKGQLRDGMATRVARYLPLGIPEAARTYVERSVKGGRVRRVDLRIKGDLWDFPYFDANFPGELRVTALADDVSYAFVPSLPATPTEPAFVSPWPAADAHRRRARRGSFVAELSQRSGTAGRRRVDPGSGRHSRSGRRAETQLRRQRARRRGGDAAHRQRQSGGRLDSRLAGAYHGERKCRTQTRPGLAVARPRAHRSERQRATARQRRAHRARQSAAGGRKGARRLQPKGLRGGGRHRQRLWRRTRFRRRLARRWRPALRRPRHGHGRGDPARP